jgi:hypothetical protein
MTHYEIMARFGPPTAVTQAWWQWERREKNRIHGKTRTFEVDFTDGLAYGVDADLWK